MSEKPNVKVETNLTIPKYIPWMWFIYAFLDGFKRIVSNQFLLMFTTEYTGITPVQMAGALSIARVADLIHSLFAGAIVQRSNTRFGAFRPWVIGCALCVWGGGVMQFLNPNVPISAKMVLVIVGYCIDGFSMNFIGVATNGLMAKISGPNSANRLAITSRRAAGINAGRIAINAITIPMITMWQRRGINNAYLFQHNLYGILAITAGLLLCMVSKSYDKFDPDAKAVRSVAPGDGLLKMWGRAIKNPTIVAMFFAGCGSSFGNQAISGTQSYYFRFSAGNILYMSLAGTVSSFVALGAALIAAPIASKLGKRKSAVVSYIGAGVLYFFASFLVDGNPILYIVFASVIQTTLAVVTAYGANLYLDVAEIQLYETGVDNRPFVMSIGNIGTKIAFIMQTPVLAFMLNKSGYVVVDRVGRIPDTARFVRYFCGFPGAFYIFAGIIYFIFYRIDEQQAREYAAHNQRVAEERRAAVAAGNTESKSNS